MVGPGNRPNSRVHKNSRKNDELGGTPEFDRPNSAELAEFAVAERELQYSRVREARFPKSRVELFVELAPADCGWTSLGLAGDGCSIIKA